MSRHERSASEYGDVPTHEQATMLDFSGEFLRQPQQAQDTSSEQGSPERHGSLEPDDSRKVTGALGGGAVRQPGGADQQQGGERWGGQSQSQGGQSQSQVPGARQGQAFTADEAARGPEVYEGEQEQAQAGSEVRFDAEGAAAGQEVSFRAQNPTQAEQGSSPQQLAAAERSAGIVDQQAQSLGGEPSGQSAGDAASAGSAGSGGQQAPFDGGGARQQGDGWQSGSPQAQQGNVYAAQIREHMEVIGADGVHLGTVDGLDGNRIKLTKADSGMGSHRGHHHYISCGLVAEIEGNTVRLSATAANAYAMEEEE